MQLAGEALSAEGESASESRRLEGVNMAASGEEGEAGGSAGGEGGMKSAK